MLGLGMIQQRTLSLPATQRGMQHSAQFAKPSQHPAWPSGHENFEGLKFFTDLSAVDVLSATQDHVLLPVHDRDVAMGIYRCQIACIHTACQQLDMTNNWKK